MPRGRPKKLAEVTEIDAEDNNTGEEYELVSFLDGLGPQGVSEVTLYRLAPTGKQKFVTSGPPGQFTEAYVQQTYGGGDYMVRARLNGRWFRSKNFSIEGAPNGINGNSHDAGATDMERLRLDLEAQRLRLQEQQAQMEADRQARDQRNHELQLALIESSRHTSAPPVSVTDMITGLKSLKDMSSGQDEILSSLEKSLGIVERISNIRGGGDSGGGGWMDWLKPVAVEAGKQLLPRLMPMLGPNAGPQPSVTVPAGNVQQTASVSPPSEPPPQNPVGDAPLPNPEEQYAYNKRQAVEYILPIARLGRDPEFYAELGIEQVETTNNPVIARMLDEIIKAESFEAWFRELQSIEPTVITSQRWFELFFLAVRDAINAKSQEPDDH